MEGGKLVRCRRKKTIKAEVPICDPILYPEPPPKLTIWQQIVKEDADMQRLYNEKKSEETNFTITDTEKYLENMIFPSLTLATEYAAKIAKERKMYKDPKKVFNGVDAISGFLTNLVNFCDVNDWKPAYFHYRHKWYTYNRPLYPLHWILTKDEASVIIQAAWRRYYVRKYLASDLVDFWKIIKAENWKPSPYFVRLDNIFLPKVPIKDRYF